MLAVASPTRADIDPASGIDLVRITHPGNAPWMGDGHAADMAVGRGRVDYEYSIGKFEVTTADWVQFYNAAFDRPANDRIPFVGLNQVWGAVGTAPNTPGGLRWPVPAGQAMHPVGGISWRMAAIYCNWLCNGKSTERSAFLTGAYDVSTFGFSQPEFRFTDQQAHTPGARYWVPTWDEIIKACYYDPNRFGADRPGYWPWNNSSTNFALFGPPGTGAANYGWHRGPGGLSPYDVLLGEYPQTLTPWGLVDAAGATTEWSETIIDAGELYRVHKGSYWDSSTGTAVSDSIYTAGGELPHIDSLEFGLRIASSVPSPAFSGFLFVGLVFRRGRRGTPLKGERTHETRTVGLSDGGDGSGRDAVDARPANRGPG